METEERLLTLAALLALFASVNPARAQTWTQTSAPITNWTFVASSADGTKLVAVAGYFIGAAAAPLGLIYTSQDSGATWMPTGAPSTNWTFVASSADGMKLVAVGNGENCYPNYAGLIYTSPDSGATWVLSNAPRTNWASVASSADGTRLVAVVGGGVFGFNCGGPAGPIYISTDSGATWMATSAPIASWNSVASSADGSKLAAAGNGLIYFSTDSGLTWTATSASGSHLGSVACSADGTKLLAGTHNLSRGSASPVYTSTNSGATWEVSNLANNGRDSVACSADGTKLVGVAAGTGRTGSGLIITSTNCGVTWTLNSTTGGGLWSSVASSADGTKFVAADYGGGIYTSQSTPMPVLSLTSAGSNLVFSWVVPSIDFVLQESPDLETTNWTDVTTAPTLNFTNLHYQVIVSPPSGNRFFRLVSH